MRSFVLSVVTILGGVAPVLGQIAVTFEAPGYQYPGTGSGNPFFLFNGETRGFYGPPPQSPSVIPFGGAAIYGLYQTPVINGMQILAADVNGGSAGTDYFAVSGNSSATLTLNNSLGYFGIYVTAGDKSNQISFQQSDGNGGFATTYTFRMVDLLTSGQLTPFGTAGGTHFGSPEPGTLGQNDGEAYVSLNFYAQTLADRFDRVTLTQAGTGSFESDNHSIAFNLVSPGDYTGTLFAPTPVPEPAGLLALAAIGFGVVRRFRG